MVLLSRRNLMLSGVSFAGVSLSPAVAISSHHFETALVREMPNLSITDLYVFPNPENDHLVLIAAVNFGAVAGASELYYNGALYNFHISADDEYTSGLTLSFMVNGSAGIVYLLDQPNAAVGTIGTKVGAFKVGEATVFDNGIRIWAGLAKDPFFGNAPGIVAFQSQQAAGKFDPDVFKNAAGENIFEGRTSAPIVVEIPNAMLGKKANVFATSAYKPADKWEQVQYVGKPLISHTMMYELELVKAAYDRTRPTTQEDFRSIFAARIARSAGLANSQANPFAYADATAAKLIPDVISYEIGTEARFSAQHVNGRALKDDAMSEILTILIGQVTSQYIEDARQYQDKFPYILPVT
jgi:hypothetical protein